MSTDTPDELFAPIEKMPEGLDDASGIVASSRLSLQAADLGAQKPAFEGVCEKSEIKEERVFSKPEILKLMTLFALSQKLELKDLEVVRQVTDKEGALLLLRVKAPNPGGDGGYRELTYIIKGKHERVGQNATSNIDQAFYDKDDMPEGGAIIVEYRDGKWHFSS